MKKGRTSVRDDFSEGTRDILARRVGFRCSNPDCRKLTNGPRKAPKMSIGVGVAAHITAAAPGGPRFDATMSPEERSSIENGVWLCQNCAKLVDNDEQRFAAGVLEEWKRIAEGAAMLEVQSGAGTGSRHSSPDEELLRFFTQCFDRPVFQDPFRVEGSMEAFDRAIEDTITAINTGCLRDRRGRVVAQAKGKAFIVRHEWRREMDMIIDLLRAIRSRYRHATTTGEIHVYSQDNGDEFYAINNPEVAEWMDATRSQVIELFSHLCEPAGLPGLNFPRRPWGPRW